MSDTVSEHVRRQKEFFATGVTRSLDYRLDRLDRLRSMIEENETAMMDALKDDLGKPHAEAYTSETGFLLAEIRFVKKHLKRWARPRKVRTMLFHQPAKSRIVREPYGVVCILGPWNYPFQLVLSPLIGAIAGGNCAILKPSELCVRSTALLADMIEDYFDPQYLTVVTGNADRAAELVRQPFDYIFFTGSTATGKKILKAAAANMTPCTLELGGKNVCIVARDADIPKTARRIAWGKFFNAGQTCAAPDHIMVSRDAEELLKRELKIVLDAFYGDRSRDYARIINTRHFDRVMSLIEGCNVIHGGSSDRDSLWIEPTLVDSVTFSDRIMEEEIFGPVLPIVGFDDLDELIAALHGRPKPLALYVFSRDRNVCDTVIERLSAGTVCVNGTFSQMISFTLPFGGVGESGMGRYHGRYSFDTFTHEKSVMYKSLLFDMSAAYPPYDTNISVIKKAMRVLFRHI